MASCFLRQRYGRAPAALVGQVSLPVWGSANAARTGRTPAAFRRRSGRFRRFWRVARGRRTLLRPSVGAPGFQFEHAGRGSRLCSRRQVRCPGIRHLEQQQLERAFANPRRRARAKVMPGKRVTSSNSPARRYWNCRSPRRHRGPRELRLQRRSRAPAASSWRPGCNDQELARSWSRSILIWSWLRCSPCIWRSTISLMSAGSGCFRTFA